MKCLVDLNKLKAKLAPMDLPSRGRYITLEIAAMLDVEHFPEWAENIGKKVVWPKIYTDAFERFWAAYPSRGGVKSGKAPAWKAWQKAVGSPADEWNLLDRCTLTLAWQCETEQWREAKGKYIPMASTYLNQRRFEDERPAPEETPPPTAGMDWQTFE